jgi:hypothetical protein
LHADPLRRAAWLPARSDDLDDFDDFADVADLDDFADFAARGRRAATIPQG